jgi:hypothetical protein
LFDGADLMLTVGVDDEFVLKERTKRRKQRNNVTVNQKSCEWCLEVATRGRSLGAGAS